jgi:hypothetical protein
LGVEAVVPTLGGVGVVDEEPAAGEAEGVEVVGELVEGFVFDEMLDGLMDEGNGDGRRGKRGWGGGRED